MADKVQNPDGKATEGLKVLPPKLSDWKNWTTAELASYVTVTYDRPGVARAFEVAGDSGAGIMLLNCDKDIKDYVDDGALAHTTRIKFKRCVRMLQDSIASLKLGPPVKPAPNAVKPPANATDTTAASLLANMAPGALFPEDAALLAKLDKKHANLVGWLVENDQAGAALKLVTAGTSFLSGVGVHKTAAAASVETLLAESKARVTLASGASVVNPSCLPLSGTAVLRAAVVANVAVAASGAASLDAANLLKVARSASFRANPPATDRDHASATSATPVSLPWTCWANGFGLNTEAIGICTAAQDAERARAVGMIGTGKTMVPALCTDIMRRVIRAGPEAVVTDGLSGVRMAEIQGWLDETGLTAEHTVVGQPTATRIHSSVILLPVRELLGGVGATCRGKPARIKALDQEKLFTRLRLTITEAFDPSVAAPPSELFHGATVQDQVPLALMWQHFLIMRKAAELELLVKLRSSYQQAIRFYGKAYARLWVFAVWLLRMRSTIAPPKVTGGRVKLYFIGMDDPSGKQPCLPELQQLCMPEKAFYYANNTRGNKGLGPYGSGHKTMLKENPQSRSLILTNARAGTIKSDDGK